MTEWTRIDTQICASCERRTDDGTTCCPSCWVRVPLDLRLLAHAAQVVGWYGDEVVAELHGEIQHWLKQHPDECRVGP